jgi:hypothetical protein
VSPKSSVKKSRRSTTSQPSRLASCSIKTGRVGVEATMPPETADI